MKTLRKQLYEQFIPGAWPREGLSPVNIIIVVCILAAVAVAILDTEPALSSDPRVALAFDVLNSVFAFVFTAELACRFWVIGLNDRYSGLSGRARYLLHITTLIDIIALLPFYLTLDSSGGFVLRLVRFMRIITLAKLGKYSVAGRMLLDALVARRFELAMSSSLAGLALLFSATSLYLVESEVQPEAFGSIPRALWWSVATLTTVGYGDVYPVTLAGRILGGISAIAAIGIIAMPTGILAAAFSDAFQKQTQHRDDK